MNMVVCSPLEYIVIIPLNTVTYYPRKRITGLCTLIPPYSCLYCDCLLKIIEIEAPRSCCSPLNKCCNSLPINVQFGANLAVRQALLELVDKNRMTLP
jgi:hypothetical protein